MKELFKGLGMILLVVCIVVVLLWIGFNFSSFKSICWSNERSLDRNSDEVTITGSPEQIKKLICCNKQSNRSPQQPKTSPIIKKNSGEVELVKSESVTIPPKTISLRVWPESQEVEAGSAFSIEWMAKNAHWVTVSLNSGSYYGCFGELYFTLCYPGWYSISVTAYNKDTKEVVTEIVYVKVIPKCSDSDDRRNHERNNPNPPHDGENGKKDRNHDGSNGPSGGHDGGGGHGGGHNGPN